MSETAADGFPFSFGDTGCQHREHEGASLCNKVCDRGQTRCPFHRLLAESETNPTSAKPPRSARSYQMPRAYRE